MAVLSRTMQYKRAAVIRLFTSSFSHVDHHQRLLEFRTEAEVADGQEEGHRQIHTRGTPVGTHEVMTSSSRVVFTIIETERSAHSPSSAARAFGNCRSVVKIIKCCTLIHERRAVL